MERDREANSFGGRVRRYARVSSTMGGLAARVAGERYLGVKLERNKHAEEIKAALGGLKGPLMKVAQILATIPEALPAEYAEELRQLQSNAPPMGWPFVKRRMAAELGADWQASFAEFGREAAAAASLGQVHRATGTDGRSLACKLQYPDMQSAVEADLKQLRWIFSLYERYDSAISTKQIHAEIGERLREELDYELEAKHARLYHDILADEPNVHIPEVVPALSTKRLLTSTWLEGQPILSFVEGHADQRNRLAMNMFKAWYVPLYYYGVIHGDPHLGNYTVRPADDTINLLDFGCVRVFPPSFVEGVIDLYNALRTDDRDLAVHAYETWGFRNLSHDLVEVLNIWASFIYAPILEDTVRTIGETNHGVYGRETAEKVHLRLREVGGVEVPREFVFMDRAALGLGSVFLHLKAEINWYQLFQELIADFDRDKLAERQAGMLAKHGIRQPAPAGEVTRAI
ncbi:MAG: AarF/ABC1/UbiB kinase family protein [Alphaproteobacteria bacterium]|jgi:predicted unusual protein kinase regulating ubiquinone biosynthesis (AarF/ABC1/UbiB family)|nr:AarF/ABC1/UbiB kinase family protein [Alphaproteobacteria bacterium]